MSRSVQKQQNLDPESEDDEDGYVKIRYQQPHFPSLEIPTDDNGDLPWKLVQALDSKISGLVIQSKEMRRIMKIKNGVIKEPKKGWKEFTVIALLEEPNENAAEEAIRSTALSHCNVSSVSKIEVKTEEENIPATGFAYSTNMSTPSPISPLLPELACIAKSVDSNKEHSVSENVTSVHDSGFSTNSSQKLFDKYKNALIQRISKQNLKIPIKDPLFLDRFLYMRKNIERYSLPKSLKPPRLNCLCKKFGDNLQNIVFHILSINHITNALTQKDFDLICKLLSFVQKDKNGYKILLPLLKRKTDKRKAKKRRANDGKASKDTVAKKRSKKI